MDFSTPEVPLCSARGGLLKSYVVYFGETVATERVDMTLRALDRPDAMLVVGSSMMVYSSVRFVQVAAHAGNEVTVADLGPRASR